ncbi:MAG: hypothetical protein R3Y35_09895 [Clostridia bacterium]
MKKLKVSIMAVALCLTMTLSVSATFVSSIEGKPAPDVAVQTDDEGNEYVAVLTDAEGNVTYVELDAIVVTPLSASTELDAEAQEMVDNAYNQISEASDLSEIAPAIVDVLDVFGTSIENLVVQDLFDLYVPEEYYAILENGGSITIGFNVSVADDETLIVLHNYEADLWEVIDPSLVSVSGGVAHVTFNSLSPIAFVVDSTETSFNEDSTTGDATDTQTGDSINYAVIIVLIASVAALILVISKKYLVLKK